MFQKECDDKSEDRPEHPIVESQGPVDLSKSLIDIGSQIGDLPIDIRPEFRELLIDLLVETGNIAPNLLVETKDVVPDCCEISFHICYGP